jgi:hypothetical protein
VLVVYAAYTTRATLQDSLYAFQRYSGARVFYLNLRMRRVPSYLISVDFDLIIYHTLFFSGRYDASFFRRTVERARPLVDLRGYKIAMPQDEYINAEVVNEFINEFAIDAVFSVQPSREWASIYDTVDRTKVRFHPLLTGYLDERRIRRARKAWMDLDVRPIDIGYRTTGRAHAWFGRHGFLKEQIASVFSSKAVTRRLRIDISTDEADTLLGDRWYAFLGRCKYVLGVEGGTSILDRDGSIRARTEEFRARHPEATFEEIERACFPGVDGTFSGFAISPRHLEACAAGTCQILTEGHYNGVLEAGRHYIPVRRDFTDVDEVLDEVERDGVRRGIVERAYQDVVTSGKYSLVAFVKYVFDQTPPGKVSSEREAGRGAAPLLHVYLWMRVLDLGDRAIATAVGRLQPWLQRIRAIRTNDVP